LVIVSLSARRSIVTSSSVSHHLLVSCRLLISRSSSRCWSSSYCWSSSCCWSSSRRQSSSCHRLSSCHWLLSVIISRCRSSVVLSSSSIIVCHYRLLLVIVIHHRRQLSSTVIISHRPPSSSCRPHGSARSGPHDTCASIDNLTRQSLAATPSHATPPPPRPPPPLPLVQCFAPAAMQVPSPTDWESSLTSLAAPAIVGQRHKTAPANCQSMPHTSSLTLHYSALVRAHELLDV